MTARQQRLFSIIVAAGLVATVSAQTPKPTFEVASVKRNMSGNAAAGQNLQPGGRYTATNLTLQRLILNVYGIREDQLVGGPNWVRTERFDINAQAGTSVSRDEIYLMVRSLLEDRFKLVLDDALVEREVFVLELARADRRLGPDLRQADESECSKLRAAKAFVAPPKSSTGARPSIAGACATIANLAAGLERPLQTTVVEKTGLSGTWNYVVAHGGLQPRTAFGDLAADPVAGVSLFVALQEQLGLKLERQRRDVSILVIDSVQPPTED